MPNEIGRSITVASALSTQRLGLAEEIDGRVQLLKRHLPYQESDHVLNLAYNALLWAATVALTVLRIATEPRRKAPRVKEAIVRFKGS
ncbi:MAG: hypothetical protein JO170_27955 [Verrucomicrobia bacterium]|nr:hypothetical protein [Verrucomicrobiota bacterium]